MCAAFNGHLFFGRREKIDSYHTISQHRKKEKKHFRHVIISFNIRTVGLWTAYGLQPTNESTRQCSPLTTFIYLCQIEIFTFSFFCVFFPSSHRFSWSFFILPGSGTTKFHWTKKIFAALVVVVISARVAGTFFIANACASILERTQTKQYRMAFICGFCSRFFSFLPLHLFVYW